MFFLIVNLLVIFEKMNFQFGYLEMEFEAETWWFCSTHEYSKTTKFQLQTPSLNAPTGTRNVTRKKLLCNSLLPAGLLFRNHLKIRASCPLTEAFCR